jgi:hypothetical protein
MEIEERDLAVAGEEERLGDDEENSICWRRPLYVRESEKSFDFFQGT